MPGHDVLKFSRPRREISDAHDVILAAFECHEEGAPLTIGRDNAISMHGALCALCWVLGHKPDGQTFEDAVTALRQQLEGIGVKFLRVDELN